ncbi:MAG: hypothetical protein PHT83_06655 [Bacilli bacterium]|nr:hypothetical protein [Bacilli bacterium]
MKKCEFCSFLCQDEFDECVFCGHKLIKTKDEFIKYNYQLKDKLDEESLLKYYCYKCKKTSINKHCVVCNTSSLLALEYKGKHAIINYIEALTEVFSQKEAEEISLLLTPEEKYYLFYRFKEGYLYYDKHKIKEGFIYLFMGIFILLMGLSIGNNILDSSLISYIGLLLSYLVFMFCANVARWNFINANKLLDHQIHIEAFVNIVGMGLIYFVLMNVLKWSFINSILLGLGYVLVVIIIFGIIEIVKYILKKNKSTN